jgi:hypothetical protein
VSLLLSVALYSYLSGWPHSSADEGWLGKPALRETLTHMTKHTQADKSLIA